MERRDFILAAGQAAAFAGLRKTARAARQGSPEPLKVIIFSKHLQFLGWDEMARTAAGIGFDGIDLTVRNGGHVLPERVEEDLPKAAEVIRKAGLMLPMVTTGIVDSESPYAEAILRTLGRLDIRRYRWGGLRYVDSAPIPEQLEGLKVKVARLRELNRKYGVCAMYHTHRCISCPIAVVEF